MGMEEKYQDACMELDYNRVDEAQKKFEVILAEETEYYPALNKLGVIFIRKNQTAKARDFFERALAVNPGYAPSLVNLGSLCSEEGNNEAAMTYYKLAVEKDASYHMAYYNLAVMYKKNGQYDAYMKYIKEYKKYYRHYISERRHRDRLRLKRKLGCLTGVMIVFLGTALLVVVLML